MESTVIDQFFDDPNFTDLVDKKILDYLSNNKELVNKFINSNGLYNVYMRQVDPFLTLDHTKSEIHLLMSFSTYTAAEEWVIKNGKVHVKELKDNYGTMIVLTIIHQINC